jgi:hypothetical protein
MLPRAPPGACQRGSWYRGTGLALPAGGRQPSRPPHLERRHRGTSGTIKPVQNRTARRGRRWVGAPRTRGPALGSRRVGHSTTSSSPVGSARQRANIASKAGPTGVGSPSRHASTWALTIFSTSFSSARWAAMSWRPGLVWRRPRLAGRWWRHATCPTTPPRGRHVPHLAGVPVAPLEAAEAALSPQRSPSVRTGLSPPYRLARNV